MLFVACYWHRIATCDNCDVMTTNILKSRRVVKPETPEHRNSFNSEHGTPEH